MNRIQVVLIAGFLFATLLCFLANKNRFLTRLFFLAQFLLALALVLWPQLAQSAAEFLGVGRGTDLILYLLVVYVYIGSVLILGKFRQLERQATELSRQIALQTAQQPEKKEHED
ncbi:MAG: DUF2304 domain-containing protein [Lentisphaeria bacterium]|jgi:hypothetical protein|nr:DUF2304 domain-containing protein [Lentisphaeria bacterium]MDY0175620.1 DUF2304 domain-containing protein [Lentisphaeria bacterium]NLZ59987.1 DUF2304 domain-containing protein [Lentisphaerota bacterium]